MLKVIEFIKNNNDWEEKLSSSPYCITIKRDEDYIILCYSQIDSDFTNDIVKECRGIILDKEYNAVCIPFFKFGNYGESYADEVDWDTARIQEKVDGSLIKVWFHNGEWHVSTNGTINAKNASLQSDLSPFETFYDLFDYAKNKAGLDFGTLNKNYTWMFEVVSPWNRVVVQYKEEEIFHIGTRNNVTLKEEDIDIGVKKPRLFPMKTLQECIDVATTLSYNEEGYVVVDGFWHRNKIKSPAYVAAHRLKNNGVVTKARVIDIILAGNDDDFVSYFPEYSEAISTAKEEMMAFYNNLEDVISKINKEEFMNDRKGFAELAKKTICPAFMFMWFDNKVESPKEWLLSQTSEKIERWIS